MNEKDIRKKRQKEVSKTGRDKEEEVIHLLSSDYEIDKNFLVGHPSKVMSDLEPLYIQYGKEKAMIDADICIIRKLDNKLVCVISVKTSFRERGGQTAYWALKVKEYKKDYKYILVTPDVDRELFKPEELEKEIKKKRKWRIILPHECDSVFIYSFKGKKYAEEKFFVGDEYLIEYIRNLK